MLTAGCVPGVKRGPILAEGLGVSRGTTFASYPCTAGEVDNVTFCWGAFNINDDCCPDVTGDPATVNITLAVFFPGAFVVFVFWNTLSTVDFITLPVLICFC